MGKYSNYPDYPIPGWPMKLVKTFSRKNLDKFPRVVHLLNTPIENNPNRLQIVVEFDIYQDWPIRYADGRIGYDFEQPDYVKQLTLQAFREKEKLEANS